MRSGVSHHLDRAHSMRSAEIRRAMARPMRKPPQLLQFPHYERSAEAFRRECPNLALVALECERGVVAGQDIWVFSSYAGVRSSRGISVYHHVPMTKLNWGDIEQIVI